MSDRRMEDERGNRLKKRACRWHTPDTLESPTLDLVGGKVSKGQLAPSLPLAKGEASSGLSQEGKVASWASRQCATACKDSSPHWTLPYVAESIPPLTAGLQHPRMCLQFPPALLLAWQLCDNSPAIKRRRLSPDYLPRMATIVGRLRKVKVACASEG